MDEEAIFTTALEMESVEQRAAYLDKACAGNADLRRQVEELLRAHGRAGSFLDSAAAAWNAHLPVGSQQSMAECPGTVVGPYKLLEQIGEGGMGLVFMAEQQQPVRRKVAVKILKPGMDTKQVIARFEAERQALALMDHPNIARVLDGGQTDSGRPYFVMDLVKGIPITQYCDESQLTPRDRLALFVQVCHAIQHAHHKGIIHRDVKPSNVLISRHDDTPVVKVIDFGIAKALDQPLTDKTLFTNFAQLLGTPLYMSPEQAGMSDLDVDTRSDIYSLGVLLYELLTGATPFDQERIKQAGLDEMRRIIREEDPPKPSTRISTLGQAATTVSVNRKSDPKRLSQLVRGELDWIVMKALEKDRNRRYETASAFAADVQRYLNDEPVLACPPSPWYRLGKFLRRNKAPVAVGVCLLVAALAIAAILGWTVRDQAQRQARLEGQVREGLNTARALLAENKWAAARQKLAEARVLLTNEGAELGELAAEVEAGEGELDNFQQFLDLINRGHEKEIASRAQSVAVNRSADAAAMKVLGAAGRQPAAAATLVLQAFQRYQILERDDWNSRLVGRLLAPAQVHEIRRLAYEELIWLADDMVRRRALHRTGERLSPRAAAETALGYLARAESAHQPTQGLYVLRARCRKLLGDETAYQADWQIALKTPPTVALDHYLRGLAAYDQKRLGEGVQAFEAALLVERTHYWSMMWLGYCLCDLGNKPADFVEATRVFTGCLLKQPEHAHAYFCRGNAYAKLQRYPEAAADYSQALALDPTFVAAWTNRGAVHLNLAQFQKGLADSSRAIELDPKNVDAWTNRGSAYVDMKEPAKAIAECSRAIEINPKFAPAWNWRGTAYRDLGQKDKAIADYSQVIKLQPQDAMSWYNRGNTYGTFGLLDLAIADYSHAIELDPGLPKFWNNRGGVYDQVGQPDKAVQDFSRAIELDARYGLAWLNRGGTYRKLAQSDRSLAQKAADDLSRAIELRPDLARAWIERGAVYCDLLGKPDKAVADFSQAIKLDPKNWEPWYDRGLSYTKLGQTEKAIADYSEVLVRDPRYVAAWSNRGQAYRQLGQHAKAATDFSKVLELVPKDPNSWFQRGSCYRALGQNDKAVADFSQALLLNGKLDGVWAIRGNCYLDLGQPDKAATDLSQALTLNPKLVEAWTSRGYAHLNMGQADKAAADFTQAIALEGTFAGDWSGRAQAYRGLGRYAEALADYRKAVKLLPGRARLHDGLAWLLATCPDAKVRDPAEAVQVARKAVELDAKDFQCWSTLGVAQYRAGDWKSAIAALEMSQKLSAAVDAVDAVNLIFLAMAHWRLDHHDEARRYYAKALTWQEKNRKMLAKDRTAAEELRRFRSEAEAALHGRPE